MLDLPLGKNLIVRANPGYQRKRCRRKAYYYTAGAELEWPFQRDGGLIVKYSYLQNASDLAVYNYKRHNICIYSVLAFSVAVQRRGIFRAVTKDRKISRSTAFRTSGLSVYLRPVAMINGDFPVYYRKGLLGLTHPFAKYPLSQVSIIALTFYPSSRLGIAPAATKKKDESK